MEYGKENLDNFYIRPIDKNKILWNDGTLMIVYNDTPYKEIFETQDGKYLPETEIFDKNRDKVTIDGSSIELAFSSDVVGDSLNTIVFNDPKEIRALVKILEYAANRMEKDNGK